MWRVGKLLDLTADVVEAGKTWDVWTDTEIGKGARMCETLRKGFAQWRQDAQRAGLDRATVRQAWRLNRKIVELRNTLRGLQR